MGGAMCWEGGKETPDSRASRQGVAGASDRPRCPYHLCSHLQIGPDYVGFQRPLPFNVSTSWNPRLHHIDTITRTQCGVEHLTIEFPYSSYLGMNKEQGWNALQFWWTPNSWVNDVKIVNAGGCVH